MRTTLELPDMLFRKVKAEAALRGKSMKDFMVEIIETGFPKAGGPAASGTKTSAVTRDAAGAITRVIHASNEDPFDVDAFLTWRREQRHTDRALDQKRSARLDKALR